VQRVISASVAIGGSRVASINLGLVVLAGIAATDRPEDGERLAAKVTALRIFDDGEGRMNRSVKDAAGAILAIPQFTLFGDVRRGRRPDFASAAPPEMGRRLFDAFCGALRGQDVRVESGMFGALMRVSIEADGPVTIVATTDGWAEAELKPG